MKAIAYLRVSKEDQNNERQITEIKRRCELEGYKLDDNIFGILDKESGIKENRNSINQMLQYVDSNKPDFVIVTELSRLGRTREVLQTIDKLTAKGVCLISLQEGIRTLNSDGTINGTAQMVTGVINALNNFEITTLKGRIISGLKNNFLKGHAGGGNSVPYGYRRNEKVLVIDKNESEIVKMIFTLYLEGNGITKVAAYLNENGIVSKSGKKFRDAVIHKMLLNSIYTGMRRRNDGGLRRKAERDIYGNVIRKADVKKYELYEQPQLKIIEPETFERVQTMLHSNDNKQGIHQKHSYLMAGKKVVCGVCGRSYHPHTMVKRAYYVCLSKRYNQSCGNASIGVKKLESSIQLVLLRFFASDLVKQLKDENLFNQVEQLDAQLKAFEKGLSKIDKKESDLIDMKLEGDISPSVFKTKLEVVKAERKSLTNQNDLIKIEKEKIVKLIENSNDIENLKKQIKEGVKLPAKQINTIIDHITITPEHRKEENFLSYDRVLKITLHIATAKISYLLTQRTDLVYILNDTDNISAYFDLELK